MSRMKCHLSYYAHRTEVVMVLLLTDSACHLILTINTDIKTDILISVHIINFH